MKKIIPFFSFSTTLLLFSNIVIAQVGIGTSSPQGILDINSSTYGVVYPSVALVLTTDAAPVVNPQGGSLSVGTTVYNTSTTTTGADDVEPGIYSWDGTNWITHFFKRQSEIFQQPSAQRTSANAGWQDVKGLGVVDAKTFTAKYSGLYKIEVKLNFGGGDMIDNGDINTALAEGDFRFIFDGTTHTFGVKAFSTYNDHLSGGTNYSNIWVESYKTIYINLTQGQVYNFTLEFNQASATGFINDGNSGDGRGYVGFGTLCFIEYTYLDE